MSKPATEIKYVIASDTLQAFHDSGAPYRCIVGPVGSGKTSAAAWEIGYYLPHMIAERYKVKSTTWAVVRSTYGQLMDSTVRTLREKCFPWSEWHEQRKELVITWPGGIVVSLRCRACDRPDQVGNLLGSWYQGFLIDEAILVNEEIKRALKGRIGREANVPGRWGVEITNPPPVDHPLYSNYAWKYRKPPGPIPKDQPLEDHIGFWQAPGENAQNLNAGYYDKLRADNANNQEWVDRYIDGKPGMMPMGKPVYNNYDSSVHVAGFPLMWARTMDLQTGDDVGVPLYAGWDNSGDSPACVLVQRVAPMQFQVLREWYDDRMGIVDFTNWVSQSIIAEFPGAEVAHYCDPAGFAKYSDRNGGLTSNAQLQEEMCGIHLHPSRQELDMRLSAVDQLLARRDGLLIDPSCIRLVNGFQGGYVRKENARAGIGEYRTNPEKNKFSHVHDALQYIIVMLAYPNLREPRTDIQRAVELESQFINVGGAFLPKHAREVSHSPSDWDPRR